MLCRLLALALLALSPSVCAAGEEVSPVERVSWSLDTDYPEISGVGKEILQRFPPTEYLYVGLGQSPTPVIRFLKNIDSRWVVNVPLSGLRGIVSEDSLTPVLRQGMYRHLDHYIPRRHVLGGRKLLVIDYSYSGESITHAGRIVTEYARDRGRNSEVHTLALTDFEERPETATQHNLVLGKRYGSLRHALQGCVYKEVSEYGAAMWSRIGEVAAHKLHSRREFALFGKLLGKKMAADRSLEQIPKSSAKRLGVPAQQRF
jgi:hypothetical protein